MKLKLLSFAVISSIALHIRAQELKTRPVQITFVKSLKKEAKQGTQLYRNLLSINLFWGKQGALAGFEFGTFANVNLYKANGLQLAGLMNVNGGGMNGLQMSGLGNVNRGPSNGILLSGGANILAGQSNGIILSGASNIINGKAKGIIFSGLLNVVNGSNHGFSFAGISNITTGEGSMFSFGGLLNLYSNRFTGFQLSGIMNVNANQFNGFQLAGLINVSKRGNGFQVATINTAGNIKGAQIGLLNIGADITGFQMGLVNLSAKNKGLAIGLINIIAENGYMGYQAAISDFPGISGGFYSGTYYCYSMVEAGFAYYNNAYSWTPRFSLGTLPLKTGDEKWRFGLEAGVSLIQYNELWNGKTTGIHISPTATYKLNEKYSLAFGPVYQNVTSSLKNDQGATVNMQLSPLQAATNFTTENFNAGWIGFKLALRIKAGVSSDFINIKNDLNEAEASVE